MQKKSKRIKILLSFVGSNDAGNLLENGKGEGAIITALRNESFNEVILLWNENNYSTPTYAQIVKHLNKEVKQFGLAKKIIDHKMNITDVTNHNQIYTSLKSYVDKLTKDNETKYTASITSGTPAMQVCWILLGESGEFSEDYPLRLIQVKDPKFGKSKNIEVELGTALPKIISLKEEVETLKKNLVPTAKINISRSELSIGGVVIKLSPIEFCYYRYFAERVIGELGDERFSGFVVKLGFMKKIYKYHQESFEFLDTNRMDLGKMIKKKEELAIQTFRGNVSKLNKKIRNTLNNDTLADYFQISIEGSRGAKFYGIKAPKEKLLITKD